MVLCLHQLTQEQKTELDKVYVIHKLLLQFLTSNENDSFSKYCVYFHIEGRASPIKIRHHKRCGGKV